MAYDGTLKFDTSVDGSGFQKEAGKLGDIVKGLGVFKLIEKGIDLIVASMDRAVLRYDTMNKFPKVLENMGYSAEASSAATQKLANGVQGLPTALDEVVATAQRLTVLTGNLEDSTDTTLALNNAFLASGSGAADASRGIVQYTQMLTKGKVDIISWRTLQETMGYALQKTAEAFGFAGQAAQNDLYAALKNGDITFTEFNAKLVELDQAVGGFAEMAKTSTGGINTAFTNMKTRIAAGVTEIIAALDRGFAQTRFKSIENIISSTGTTIKTILTGVAGAFEFVAANSEILIPAITILGGAFVALKAQAAISSLISALSAAFQLAATQATALAAGNTAAASAMVFQTTAEKALTVAMAAGNVIKAAATTVLGFFTASSATATGATLTLSGALHGLGAAVYAALGPVGLIIAAAALLVAGIVALISWINNSNQAYKEGKKYVEDYGKANEELASSFDESTSAFKDNQNAAEANANTSKDMLAGLQDLAGKGLNRTAEETYKLQAKINTLNSAQQGLNLTIDETTGELSMTNEEIEAYIAATQSAAKAQALEDHMKALGEQLVGVESQFVDAQRQIMLWEQQVANGELPVDKYEKLVKSLNEEMVELEATQSAILDEMAINEEAYSQLLAQQEQERQALIDLQEDAIREFAAQHHLSYDEIRADMDENNLSFAEWQEENQKTLDKSQEGIAEFADKWGYSLDDVNAAITASGLTIEEYLERQDEALEHAKEVLTDYTTTVSNGFSVMEQETAISLENFMENMKKNEEATANWADNMNTLMDLGINQGVIEQLAAMGPEGALQAQAFVDELTEMNGGVDLALGQTSDTVAAKLAEIDDTFSSSLETASAAADTQLRAESYYQAGYASIDKIASGISENQAAVNAATQSGTDIAQSITSAVETVDFSSTGQTIGNSIVTSLTNAIQSGASKITGAVTSVSTAVQNAFKTMATQSQNSVTQMMTQINSAIVTRAGTVKASITSMGNGVTTAMSTMKTQAANLTQQMMTEINSAIVTRTSTVKSSATALANGVVSALESMVSGAENVANRMMDGIGTAMDNKAPSLYAKAREIANRIASIMAEALDVHSPSRVMIKLFENVMMGIYVGMDNMAGMLFREADSIADGLAERLTISPEVLADQLRSMTEYTPLGGSTLVPQLAGVGAGGGTRYVTSLTQNITTPKPLSASEMTREGQDLLRRQRWQLP